MGKRVNVGQRFKHIGYEDWIGDVYVDTIEVGARHDSGVPVFSKCGGLLTTWMRLVMVYSINLSRDLHSQSFVLDQELFQSWWKALPFREAQVVRSKGVKGFSYGR